MVGNGGLVSATCGNLWIMTSLDDAAPKMVFTSPCLGISAAVGNNTLGRLTVTDQHFEFTADTGLLRKLFRKRLRVSGPATDIKQVAARKFKDEDLYRGKKLLTLLTAQGEISVILSDVEADFAAAQIEQLIESLASEG